MNYLEKFFDGVHYVFNLNAATLSGAIDIIVVEQEDGTLKCTPFHVRFGKLQLLNSREKVVSLTVNDVRAEFSMKLGNAGEAFFVEETDEPVPSFLATSPMSSPKGSRRNSRTFTTPPLAAFVSTEELVPELVGPRRIIQPIKQIKSTKTSPTPSSSNLPATLSSSSIANTTTTKTIAEKQLPVEEGQSLTSALEALIQSENQESDGNYSDSDLIPKAPRSGNTSVDMSAPAPSYYLYESPVGSPKDEIEYMAGANSSVSDVEEGAAWRLAWGWGGLPKITRRAKPTPKDPEYGLADPSSPQSVRPGTPTPNSSPSIVPGSTNGPNGPSGVTSGPTGPNSELIPVPPTPPLATPNVKAADLVDGDRDLRELRREGSSWTRSIIRYFKPGDAKPAANGENERIKNNKKPKEENVTVDGGVFMMDTGSNIRESGTASELTDTTNTTTSDSDSEEEGEEEREFMDAQSELPAAKQGTDGVLAESTEVSSSPETDDVFATPLLGAKSSAIFPSDAVAVSILDMDPEEEKRRAQKRIIERHGSISYETTLLVGDSEEDSMPIPVTVTAPLKMSSPSVPEPPISILADANSLPSSDLPITSTPASHSHSPPGINKEAAESPIISRSPSSVLSSSPPLPIVISSSAPATTSDKVLHNSAPPSLNSSMVDLPTVTSTSSTRPLLATFSPPLTHHSLSSSPSSSLSPNFRPPSPSSASLRSSAPSTMPSVKSSSPSTSPPRPSTPINDDKPEKTEKTEKIDRREDKGEKKDKKEEKDKAALVMSPLDVGTFKVEISVCASQLPAIANNKELIDSTFAKHKVSYDDLSSNPALLSNPDLVFKFNDRLYPWSIAAPYLVSVLVFHQPLKPSALEALTKAQEKSKRSSWGYFWPFRGQSNRALITDAERAEGQLANGNRPSSPPIQRADSQKIQELKKELQQQLPQQGEEEEQQNTIPPPGSEQIPQEDEEEGKPKKYSKKTLRPTAEQLKSLGLKPGTNTITFSVTSTLQGTRAVTARIFLWDNSAKIVVSDIDGTITKSDVFGQIAPIIGRDWTHAGVAQLYSNISKNGYRIVYLTSRAIGQAGLTRGFITSVKQGEAGTGLFLPEGPIMLSPNRLLASINREVIRRNPEEFKIACLKDIKALFPPGHSNFYAGFGNRITDAVAYTAVGIPKGRVFTINPMGIIININNTYKKSYLKLNEVVWEMFPPLHLGSKTHLDEKYNEFNYWRNQSSVITTSTEFDF